MVKKVVKKMLTIAVEKEVEKEVKKTKKKANHAERFQQFADALDKLSWAVVQNLDTVRTWYNINPSRAKSLRHFLRCWVFNEMRKRGRFLETTPLKTKDKWTKNMLQKHVVLYSSGEPRRALPDDLVALLRQKNPTLELTSKVEISWIVAYCEENYPDQTVKGWTNFECSHLCGEVGLDIWKKGVARNADAQACINADCLVWEGKSVNQARANPGCHKICHCGCGETVCKANNVHQPPCN